MSAGAIMAAFGKLRVGRVTHPDNKPYEGRALHEVASELGVQR